MMKRLIAAVLFLAACGGTEADRRPTFTVAVTVPPATAPLATTTPTTAPAPVSTSAPSTIDTEWFDRVVLGDTVGQGASDVQAAVVRDGEVVHQIALSASSSLAPVTVESRFRIASISKVATAMAVMRLVEDGVMSLEDRPLAEVAGRLGFTLGDPRMNDVTVYQLLSHTSGLASGQDYFFDSPDLDTDRLLTATLSAPLADQPGRQFTYSNTNFVILGRLVGWRTGANWEGGTHQLVLDPLGLNGWTVGRTSESEDGDAKYAPEPDRNYMELLEASGAWIASATQTALLVDALGRGTVFRSPATSRMMLQPSSAGPPGEDWTYGLGVRIFAGDVWGHSGTLENVHDMVVWLPDGTVVCVLVNGTEPSDSDRLIDTIRRALNPEPSVGSLAPSTSVG